MHRAPHTELASMHYAVWCRYQQAWQELVLCRALLLLGLLVELIVSFTGILHA